MKRKCVASGRAQRSSGSPGWTGLAWVHCRSTDLRVQPVDGDEEGQAVGTQIERKGGQSTLLEHRHGRGGTHRVGIGRLVAADERMVRVLCRACTLAPSDAPIALHGESGVGKELLAQAIHRVSGRGAGPFVALNCAALPEDLAEAELFGCERGAYTGADSARAGAFEVAHGGTLFLDEVGELAPGVQAKLLRALEEGEVRRLGSQRTIRVDTRIVSATHRDLVADAQQGRFRVDLLYRLRVLPIGIPPLCERPADLPAMAEAVLRETTRNESLDDQVIDALAQHRWPGNARELRNVLIRASLSAGSGPIRVRHLEFDAEPQAVELERMCGLRPAVDRIIAHELRHQGGHRRRTYEALGMPRSTFYRWLRRQSGPGAIHVEGAPR